MGPSPTDITPLLARSVTGKGEPDEKLIEIIYSELRQLAGSYFRHERPNHTLQPTALVNEACLRLLGAKERNWENKAQFFSIAAKVMRNVLIDHARKHRSHKRGAGLAKVQFDEA